MLFLFLSIHHCIVSLNVFIAINTRTAAGDSLLKRKKRHLPLFQPILFKLTLIHASIITWLFPANKKLFERGIENFRNIKNAKEERRT